MKKIVVIAIAALVVGAGAVFYIVKSVNSPYELATVKRGDIVQEVIANGNVKLPTTINLSFQSPGKLVLLDAYIGESVRAGDVLAKQDPSLLQVQLRQAQADISVQQARLDSLKSGKDQRDLANDYNEVVNTLNDSYAKADDAIRNQASQFMNNPYFQPPASLQADRIKVEEELTAWKSELDKLTDASSTSVLDQSISDGQSHSQSIFRFLNEVMNEVVNSTTPLASYKTAVAAARAEVTTAIGNLNSLASRISSQKQLIIQNSYDIGGQEALVAQAQAGVALIQTQIDRTILTSPSDAIVIETNGSIGENIAPNATVVSLIPTGAPEIKLNVSEDNIVGVRVGQPVSITLDAFPNTQAWMGKVVRIDPAQTVVGGATYYQTTVLFDKIDSSVKPGMSVTGYIRTGTASSALTVPASAIQINGTNTYVRLYKNGKVVDRDVTAGLRERNGTVEIVSGLSEGDQVVIGNK